MNGSELSASLYCANISEQQYKILCENNTPFLCPSCHQEQQGDGGELNELKGTAARDPESRVVSAITTAVQGARTPCECAVYLQQLTMNLRCYGSACLLQNFCNLL